MGNGENQKWDNRKICNAERLPFPFPSFLLLLISYIAVRIPFLSSPFLVFRYIMLSVCKYRHFLHSMPQQMQKNVEEKAFSAIFIVLLWKKP